MRTFCADLCQVAMEPRHGTAPPAARAWLLVAHPGPWPAYGWPDDVAPLMTAAVRHGVRPQLIRRMTDRRRRAGPADDAYLAYTAWTAPGEAWLARRTIDDPQAAANIDLAALGRGEPTAADERVHDMLLLVCTHGMRDVCCAVKGRPLASALAARHPGAVWEVTHVGGDRYAGNLVCLPFGTYFGGLDTSAAADVAAACLRGEVSLPYYRGRAGLTAAAQSAEYYARAATGVQGVDDVRVLAEGSRPDGVVQVDLDVAGRPLRLTVRPEVSAEPVATSCTAGTFGSPVHYALTGIETGSAAGTRHR
jgi:hypothetical protein